MFFPTKTRLRSLALLSLALCVGATAANASLTAEQPTWPNDLSPAGLRAAAAGGDAAAQAHLDASILPEVAIDALRTFVIETRALGLTSRSGRVSFDLGVPNVRANDPAQAPDRVGEAQSEVSVCVQGDTVVVAWNDSRAFTVGPSPGVGTLSGYAYSLDGAATFTDGGSVPRILATDNPSGDTDIDTDGRGNWYLNSIYTRTGQQNISVHNGIFVAGVLTWNLPTMASIGTAATGNLDKCLLATDRLSGNVYVAYTRFLPTPAIEVVRSTDNGATWSVPIILDNTAVPTASKQAANPIVGPGGEVYIVWEKGANLINCADVAGNVGGVQAQIAFTKSTDGGLTYTPFTVIASPVTGFMASGPGDNRERGNEFPDIAVDRSGLVHKYNGRIYVTYHDSAPWTTNLAGGVAYAEAQNVTNNQAGMAEPIAIGMNVAGSLSSTTDFDYYSFTAVQGQDLMITLDPQGFNCGVSGTSRGMRLRLYADSTPAPTSTFSDSLLAASFQGAFTNRIVWTAPKTGTFKLRISPASGAFPATYTLKLRPLAFAPVPGGARDARDVVVIASADGGATWTAPRIVNDDPVGLENRRPFISVDAKGHVHTFWHDSRMPGTNATLTKIYGVTSRNGGANWTPNYCVTDEVSFFSFNTIAIPNMGDYNMAASYGDLTIAGWSDQRLSTGDVFNPATLTYTAGLGPEAYTARVKFGHTVLCPPGPVIFADATVDSLTFCVTNTGTTPDTYNWTVSDVNGWTAGPASGSFYILPGNTECVRVGFAMPPGCLPSNSSIVTFTATPPNDPNGEVSCEVKIQCDVVVPALIADFDASTEGAGVRLTWSAEPSNMVAGFNVYRGVNPEAILEKVNESLIEFGSGGDFAIADEPGVNGTVWYRLSAVSRSGAEVQATVISVNVNALPTAFSFRLAGANPFRAAAGTTFAFALPVASNVRVDLYNVAGRKVATLVDGMKEAGTHTISLAQAGRMLPAGGYVARFEAGAFQRNLRIIALP